MLMRTDYSKTTESLKVKIAAWLIFWPWNLLFVSLCLFGVAPFVLLALLRDTSRSLVPWDLTFTIVCLLCVPAAGIAYAVRHVREPKKLLAIFYGLEVPLCLVCLGRIFLVRELTPAMAQVVVCFSVAGAAFAFELIFGLSRRRWAAHGQIVGQSVALSAGLYSAAILGLYVPLLAFALGKEFFSFDWVRSFFQGLALSSGFALVTLLIGTVLFALSAALFIGAPFALVLLYGRSFLRVYRAFRIRFGTARASVLVTATVVLLAGLAVLLNRQPQRSALALLSHPPASEDERKRLIDNQEEIRKGLLQAYLARYRYLAARKDSTGIRTGYEDLLHARPGLASTLQRLHDVLLSPVLYDGDFSNDPETAKKLYAEFFDAPIQRRESASILRALAATWESDEREAGLLNQDQRKVKLVRQEVRVAESGSTAEIEIHDQYANMTYEQQEILLYFSLPESAVVTGLWLGETADRSKRFYFAVSPRGAAQAVYRAEVARRADPALIEQIGPAQYRLRAFPIPPIPIERRDQKTPPALHLWLTYVTYPQNGHWPMPSLRERRNIYWDDSTERRIGNRSMAQQYPEEWVGRPPQVKVASNSIAEEAVLAGGYLMRRTPLLPGRIVTPSGKRFAVVIDRSFSMSRVEDELGSSLADVARIGRKNENDIDFYLTSAKSRGSLAERVDDVDNVGSRPYSFYGSGSLKQQLQQFQDLRGRTQYDAIFLLTDDETYDNADDSPAPGGLTTPVWIVHVGKQPASGYDDETFDLVNSSGGGVATGFDEAILRYAIREQNGRIVNVDGDSIWTLDRTSNPETPVNNLARLAARQLVLALGRQVGAGDAAALDPLHRLAVSYKIVSVYSSMIVLVDDAQRRQLELAEGRQDRFVRPADPGNESLPEPTSLLTGTPEPHEWVLLGLALVVALVTVWRNRSTPLRHRCALS